MKRYKKELTRYSLMNRDLGECFVLMYWFSKLLFFPFDILIEIGYTGFEFYVIYSLNICISKLPLARVSISANAESRYTYLYKYFLCEIVTVQILVMHIPC